MNLSNSEDRRDETSPRKRSFRSPAGRLLEPLKIGSLGVLAVFLVAICALIVADISYIPGHALREAAQSRPIRAAIRLSAVTSGCTLLFVVLFSIPIGYALSRYRFPGHVVADTLVDLPIVLPPLVIGISLLVFFRTSMGQWLEKMGLEFVYTVPGIVLCQFFVSASYGIRAAKAAFDSVDPRLEHLALTLGCTPWQAFWRISLPLARNGIVAGAIMAWARSVGVFGPIMVFAGAVRMKTEILPTTIFLELSVGRIEIALAVALLMLTLATLALVTIHALTTDGREVAL